MLIRGPTYVAVGVHVDFNVVSFTCNDIRIWGNHASVRLASSNSATSPASICLPSTAAMSKSSRRALSEVNGGKHDVEGFSTHKRDDPLSSFGPSNERRAEGRPRTKG